MELFASIPAAGRQFVNFPMVPKGVHGVLHGAMCSAGYAVPGGGMPEAGATRFRVPASTLGIDGIRAAISSKLLAISDARRGFFECEIYLSGVQMRGKLDPLKEPPQCPSRGEITGFSHEAARRLKRAFMELYVPGAVLWNFSLTTHRVLDPVEWRAVMKRFRCALVKRGWAAIWRVELQKRRAPHLHCAFWLPESSGFKEVRLLWLRCTRELDDEAARAHAVKGSPIENDRGGWAAYMGMHSGKHKEEQLGWLGKQWGVWNISAFSIREPIRATLNAKEHGRFLRCVRRLETAERRRHFRKLEAEARAMAALYPLAAAAFDRKVARMRRRLWVGVMHSRMIRLMDGSNAARILDWCRGLGRSEPQSKLVARGHTSLGQADPF